MILMLGIAVGIVSVSPIIGRGMAKIWIRKHHLPVQHRVSLSLLVGTKYHE